MNDAIATFKQGARATWASGDWDTFSAFVADVGPKLLDRVGIESGMDVLDIGTGSGGTVSIPAALRGAKVTGSDLTPELFDAARRRATEAGVEVDWVEADAEDLPFEDASFDRVLSTFGHMFAPRHEIAAAELVRVCRPGGTIGFAAWDPKGGGPAEMFKLLAEYMPPPPDFAQPPVLWGTEEHVRELLEPHGIELEFDHETIAQEFGDVDGFVSRFETQFGPMIRAKAAAGDRWPELRDRFAAMAAENNQAADGTMRLVPHYLVTVGRKPA
jgi:ubiquinone/menaquinone biosynthesis C-methylase UbiE